MSIIINFNKLHKFHFCGSLNSYNPTQNLLRQIMKMPIFPIILAKTETSVK